MEAELARQFLAPQAQPRGGAGVKELTVSGSLLMMLVLKRAKVGEGGRWLRLVSGGDRNSELETPKVQV